LLKISPQALDGRFTKSFTKTLKTRAVSGLLQRFRKDVSAEPLIHKQLLYILHERVLHIYAVIFQQGCYFKKGYHE